MNRYQFMTYTLVICNIFYLVSMFIAAWWGFTYPNIIVDVYVSGKSAIIATLMCIVSCVCLCGLNYQNYYLLIIYGCLSLLFLFNEIFDPLSIPWTRTPNYPLSGSVDTQIYILTTPKVVLVVFAFVIGWRIRFHDRERKFSRNDPRCRCGQNITDVNCNSRVSHRSFHQVDNPPPPPPPPLPPPNTTIRTPPMYPSHRPSLPSQFCHSPPSLPVNQLRNSPPCLLNGPLTGRPTTPLTGRPSTPPWKERRWGSVGREYGHYFHDVYNPDY